MQPELARTGNADSGVNSTTSLCALQRTERLVIAMLRLIVTSLTIGLVSASAGAAFQNPAADSHPELFVWTDTCNAYVLRDGDSALMIDLGDGSVLNHLAEIGVKKLEWVLFMGHHRELLQGVGLLDRSVTQIAAPNDERAFFETP